MILDLDLDIGLNLRGVIQLLLSLEGSVLPIILDRVLSVIVRISSEIRWHVSCRSVDTSTASITSTTVFECLILLDKVLPDGHILSLDHMDHDSAVREGFQVLCWLWLDQGLELTTTQEEFV